MDIRYHLDEVVPPAVAHGLRKHGIDVTTARDADLLKATDSAHLEYAHAEGRVLVTHDRDFLRLAKPDTSHSGIAYCHQHHRTIGQLVRLLVALWRSRTAAEMHNHIAFL
jgi:hypothetical protein